MKWIVPYVNFKEQYKIYGKSYVKAFNRVMINGDFILRDDVMKFEQNLKKYQEESTKVSNVSVSRIHFFPSN